MHIIKHTETSIFFFLILHTYVEIKKNVSVRCTSTLGQRWWTERMRKSLFYVTVVLVKIRSEVNMTKCWYLLNLNDGCIRVYYVIFSTFILYTLRYFLIKVFNLTLPLAIVWEGTVCGVIFLLSKAEIKPSLSHSCHTTENVGLFDWPPELDICVGHGWSDAAAAAAAAAGLEISSPKSKSELLIWASSGLISLDSWEGLAVQVDRPSEWGPQYWSSLMGLEAKIGPPVRTGENAARGEGCPLGVQLPTERPGPYPLPRGRFWLLSTHARLGTKYLTLLFWLQLPLVQM